MLSTFTRKSLNRIPGTPRFYYAQVARATHTTRMPRSLDLSPPRYNGPLNPLDTTVFTKSLPLIAVRVPPNKTSAIINASSLKKYIVRVPKLSPVVRDPANPEGRLVILNIDDSSELSPEAVDFLKQEAQDFLDYTVTLDYDFWTAADIIASILPEELLDGAPTGFAANGHIAHLNLNDKYLPYKHAIGQVVLDKNKSIKTVVNKLHNIDTVFRFFQMELLAGEPDYVVTHLESNCHFTFDFSKVYWNSRLHTEHERIVDLLGPNDVLADLFAGVGPFAIPAAKQHACCVLANDLNPESAKYLLQNAKDNDVSDLVRVTCEDARDFILDMFTRPIVEPFPPYTGPRRSKTQERKQQKRGATLASTASGPPRDKITHIVMNLPDSAIEFLDAFRGVLSDPDLARKYAVMPVIHCHCFTREVEEDKAHEDILRRVETKLGHRPSEVLTIHHVRSVAPGKEMYCISFRLPTEVACSSI